MRSKVIYEEILLLSIKEGKSKKIKFNPEKNIIYGKNDTGKSTLIKSIFWTLGMNPSKLFGGGRLDRNLIGLLKLNFNGDSYYFLRNKDHHKLFDSNQILLLETESSSEWNAYMADLFNYKLSLTQRNNLEEYLVGLQGILTPYYIDQDTGWSHKWDGPFEGMHRYYDFYQQVIEHFTGIISDEVILLKQEQKKLSNAKKELEIKYKVYENAARELLNNNSFKNFPEIDKNLFNKSVSESTLELKFAQQQQILFKEQLSDIFSEKQIVINLLKNAYNLHAEALADLDTLDTIPDNSTLECPTCGTTHLKTLDANITLEFDIEGINKNIFNLQQKLDILKKQESQLIGHLSLVNVQIENFKKILQQPVAESYTFEDVVQSYSNTNIKNNIDKNLDLINEKITYIVNEIKDIKLNIDNIDSPETIKIKVESLKKGILYFYNQLNVDAFEAPNRVYLKPNISGSSSSRSILALHLAYISISYKLTKHTIFPIVIDTIQQNGQDDLNINNMIKIISMFKQPQIILGMETLSDNINNYNFNIINLSNRKYKVLEKQKFSEHLEEINSFTDTSELINL